jgi:hypothetical protein
MLTSRTGEFKQMILLGTEQVRLCRAAANAFWGLLALT